MSKVDDKVRMLPFTMETGLSPDEIRAAGARSIEAGKRLMNNTIKEDEVAGNGIRYVVKGPGGLVKQMSMVVSWNEQAAGRRRVDLKVGTYTTSRPTMFGFIPAGPKSVPALKSAQRFVESLRIELSAK